MKDCRNSSIHSTSKIESGSLVVNSVIDKYSFCGYDCELMNCKIGRYCSIANRIFISGAEHPLFWVGTSPVFYRGRDSVRKKFAECDREQAKVTYIANDVWIGYEAIVGMGAIVTKDVAPYSIVAGNPAKHIKFRFAEDVMNDMHEIQWWNYEYFVASDRASSAHYCTLDEGWNLLPYTKEEYLPKKMPEKPKHLQELVEVARKLSEGFGFVRVDLYEYRGQPYISELTFFPWGHYYTVIPMRPLNNMAKGGINGIILYNS